ncbi:MAG TPA: Ig-like domain-containing protein [Methylomirabilota bacterium]|nr:Ig-like domain-containing protein [Methylomirabilota bacterium]
MPTTLKALFPLTARVALILILAGGMAQAADFYLYAGQTTLAMPDATNVTVWGFALEPDNDFTTLEGVVEVPGPRLVVDPADPVVNIYLYNNLTEPVSLVITGQIPSAANGPVVRFAEGDPDYPAPPGTGGRIRSFAKETAPGAMEMYSWPTFRNGSFMYKSGTHQQVQVPMGLYGAITKDAAAGVAYDRATPALSVPYDSEVVLFYSELDPVLNTAVATGNYGPGMAVTSTIGFNPQYFLINGQPYPAAVPMVNGVPTVGQTTLVRMFNAGLQSLVPMVLGDHLDLAAEDGNLYPHLFTQYTVTLPAGKTIDAVFEPVQGGTYPVVERRLHLTNGATGPGGQLVSIDVAAEAGQPVAVADAYFLDEDTSLAVPGGGFVGVLDNDSDGGPPNGAASSAVLVQGPQHDSGAFALNPDGSFSYTPVADYFGGDFFLYQYDDGALVSEPVAAVIRVDPVNDPPSVVDDFYTTPEDVTLNVPAPGVAANDIDVDGDALIVTLLTDVGNGTLTLNANGSFSYTPNLDWFGDDTFTYEVADAGALTAGPATVTITVSPVNDIPVAVNDAIGPVIADTAFILGAPGVLANDTDIENDPLTAILARGPRHGGLTLNPDGSLTYTPDPGYVGPDDFRYKANDGTASSLEAIVSLHVTAPADVIFIDGFESGNTSAWSDALP